MSDAAAAASIIAVLAIVAIVIAIVATRFRSKDVPVDRVRLREVQAAWRAPAELSSAATPRNVRYAGKARAGFVLLAVVAVGAATAAAFLVPEVRREQQDDALVRREGIPAGGIITSHWADHGKSTSYHVAYAYTVDGHQYASRAEVSRSAYDGLTDGAPAAIHYAPSRPDVSRLDLAVDVPAWIKLFLFAPLIVLLVIPWRFMRLRKLLVWGTPTGAVVTRRSPVKGGIAIRYQFLDSSGEVVTVREAVSSRDAPQPGDVITVVCDPDQPRRAARYPIALVRLDDTFSGAADRAAR